MAISRYRNTESLRGKVSFKLDKKTRRPLELVFLDGQKYNTLSQEALSELNFFQIAYKRTDTLMGLAQRYYQDPSYWWLIAVVNNIGSEADLEEGNNITIITPADTLIGELGL
jgi:hypothetical protein